MRFLLKNILFIFLFFSVLFLIDNRTVFAGYVTNSETGFVTYLDYTTGGYTNAELLQACGGPCLPPADGNLGQTYRGFYQVGDNPPIYYPIELNPVNGEGPANTGGVCTGIYANCTGWSICAPTCGAGTQYYQCFDTGCSRVQTHTQTCMTNDPTIWGTPTTCSVNCGTGTQNITNQCGTTVAQACNTSACPAWAKLKDSSFISKNGLFNMTSLTPVAYDADDTTQQYFIVGAAGAVAVPSIAIDVSNIVLTAKTGSPEYKAIYTPAYSMTPAVFLSYIKARKEYKLLTLRTVVLSETKNL
jgi:hypothetical protein